MALARPAAQGPIAHAVPRQRLRRSPANRHVDPALRRRARQFSVEHYEHRFPICPQDYATILGADELLKPLADRFSTLAYQSDAYAEAAWLKQALAERATDNAVRQAIEQRLGTFDARQPEGFQRLHGLLEQQAYRLASWRTAADDINWRRFFDVNDLGGLRVERSAVFEATHGKIFELISQGLVDGLRIDHIDGLADPRGYCRKLRRRVDTLSPRASTCQFSSKNPRRRRNPARGLAGGRHHRLTNS